MYPARSTAFFDSRGATLKRDGTAPPADLPSQQATPHPLSGGGKGVCKSLPPDIPYVLSLF